MDMKDFLKRKNVSPEEYAAFFSAVRDSGKDVFITFVDDPKSPAARAARDYIKAHKMLPKNYQTLSVPEIEAQGAVLLDPQSSLKQKKKALMILAHRGSFEAYRLLKRYRRESEPEPELRVWADMAFDECKTFLRTNLYKENQIVFNAILNVGRNDPCPCGSGKKFKYCCGKA